MELDLIIRNGSLVLTDATVKMDIGISGGIITMIEERINHQATRVIDADGLVIMPGIVDIHVHLNEPGLEHWEGFETGSAALAAGGCTTYFDMPLNSIPPTVTAEAMLLKVKLAKDKSHLDFALWGGLVPGRLHHLEELSLAGSVGFKAFMSSPGDSSEEAFREVDDLTLLDGMRRIAKLQKVLAIHAESEPLISRLTLAATKKNQYSGRDYSASRPIISELEAIKRALFYAEQTSCPIHFVHVSSEAAVQVITRAKEEGMDVTLETCPHYLTFSEQDLDICGTAAKCAPPLRGEQERERLWNALRAGLIDMIASDHSPCPISMKQTDNFFEAWGGIAGGQSSLEVMIDEGYVKRGIPLSQISRLLSLHPAKRFGLHPKKGEITIGADADLVIVNTDTSYILQSHHLLQRHKHSPYVGRQFSCKVVSTLSRGNVVYNENTGITNHKRGMWIPSRRGGTR